MKSRAIVAVALCVAAFISCQGIRTRSAAGHPRPVKIDEHSVLIPGTVISADDQKAVSEIFKKYDSSLYRVGAYENGSLKTRLGKMSEMEIGAIASEYPTNAKATGLTNWTMRIGSTTHITIAGSTTHITTGGSPTRIAKAGYTKHITTVSTNSDALVKEVTPILEKYRK